MPLYEYECPGCGAITEVLQKIGENGDHLTCQHCARAGLRKVLSRCASPAAKSANVSAGVPGCSGGGGFA